MQAILAELPPEVVHEAAVLPDSKRAGPTASGAACAAFTRGGLFNPEFLRVAAPLYDQHMGAENLGPLLYSLVRFTKPQNVLELGAGCVARCLHRCSRATKSSGSQIHGAFPRYGRCGCCLHVLNACTIHSASRSRCSYCKHLPTTTQNARSRRRQRLPHQVASHG